MKNKGFISIFIVLLFLTSACSKPEVKIPADVIPKDSMVFIMMDVHIAEAGVKTLAADSTMVNLKNYYQYIYKKHRVTEEQFQYSLRFYTYHPAVLQEIYTKMAEEMSKKETEVYKMQP